MTNRKNKPEVQLRLPVKERQRAKQPRMINKTRKSGYERVGAQGERLAAEYLEKQGYQIVARNWRAPETRNEIDLIVQDQATLVFVEVKTARTRTFGDPVTWIPPRKQKSIIKAAKSFIAAHRPPNPEFRFDAVVIAPPGPDGRRALRHIPAAFTLDDSEMHQ